MLIKFHHTLLLAFFVVCSGTSDAGNVWSNHGPEYKVIKAVSISPQDTSVIYAGAFGSGVFKSTDGGSTWINLQNLQKGLTNAYVRSIYALSNTVAFCGTNDGVFKTTDGGLTWSLSLSTSFSVRSLAYDTRTGNLYAGTFGSGLFKSTNLGVSWNSIAVIDPVVTCTLSHVWSVAIFGRDSLYVGGTFNDVPTGGTLFRSLDGGTSWIQVQRGIHIGSITRAIAISPNNPATSLIIGTASRGVYRSITAGQAWVEINDALTVSPLPDRQINALAFSANYRYAGTDSIGGLFRRALSGTPVGWSAGLGLPGMQAPVSSIALNNPNQSKLYVGTEGQGVFWSTDSGFHWAPRSAGMLGVAARAVERNSNGQIILGTDFGDGIWTSSDQGSNWNRSVNLPTSNAITSIGLTNSPSVLYAGAYGTGVFKSTDGGSSWVITDSVTLNHFVRTLSVHPSNASIVYAGTGNGVYKTTDGGNQWQAKNNGIPAGTSIRSMAIYSTDPNVLYAGTDSLFMYKTTDAGASWTHMTNANGFLPQDIFIRTITIDYSSTNTVYAGSDSGRIYKSTNAGVSWALHTKLPATHSVRSLLIHPNDHRIFFAATFGDGIFMSADSGSHWVPMNDGLPDLEIYTLESDQANPLTLYAGSAMHGVYRMSFTFLNHPPILAPIGSKSVLAGNQLRFVVSAIDSDLTIPGLSVVALPSGASFFDSLNGHGLFVWTPTIGQIGTYSPTFFAYDATSADSEKVIINVLDPGTSSAGSVTVESGWNLLSVPVSETDYRKFAVFPQAISSAFSYIAAYIVKDTLRNGVGYWLKFGLSQEITYGGGTISRETTAVTAGWNLVGSVSHTIPVGSIVPVPPVSIISSTFGYSGISGYFPADSIRPLGGYWVKVNQSGNVVLSSTPAQNPVVPFRAEPPLHKEMRNRIGVLVFKNTEGGVKELSLLSQRPSPEGTELELPPSPPAGSFDVRFAATQGLVGFETPTIENSRFPIYISTLEPNLELSWKFSERSGLYTLVLQSGDERSTYRLEGEGSAFIRIREELSFATLVYKGYDSESGSLPKKVTLCGNFPNPFNPSTTIKYDLPFPAFVSLKVVDLLGRQVQELVRGDQSPGTKSVVWNAMNISSGLYLYRLEVTNPSDPSRGYVETKKMFLLR